MIYLLSQIPAAAAERRPDQVAFRCGDARLSYRDLSDSADRLAHTLVLRGLERGDRVGVYQPKCIEMAIAVYGVLRAGGAYVPIDPSSPTERVARIVDDCAMRHLITTPAFGRRIGALLEPGDRFATVLGIRAEDHPGVAAVPWEALKKAVPETPLPSLVDDDIAYIMYTSGSTGAPKGIIHTHRSGLAYARMAADLYEVGPTDRLGNFAPLHFDQSTFELFAGPLRGATTIIIPEAATKLPASLTALIERERLTHWYSVPFVLIQMLLRGTLENRDLSALRWIQYGGEPFPVQHIRELMKRLPNARFSNVYGPAEVNQCTYYHLPAPPESDAAGVPIGHMCANAEGLIVGSDDQVVADGQAGELLVRSATMMRGYWNRPDLNAIAYCRRPGGGGFERCYYRTGDRVRLNADGELEFLGRMDRQVKSRGFRIELEEVESRLAAHGDVAEAAVYPVTDASGTTTLQAVVLGRSGAEPDPRDLRRYLAVTLPSYAVPSKLDIVPALPRTGTGKIDRLRLQKMAQSRMRAAPTKKSGAERG